MTTLSNNIQISTKYQVVEKLGEGSFGEVFKVLNLESSTHYALKILKLEHLPDHAHKNLKQRFQLEYQTGRIQHPNLVQTHEINHWNQTPYFIMDLCEKDNLRNKISRGETFNQSYFETIAKSILMGLEALHKNGKVHRDLKPGNILFDKFGTAKLSDFGISGHLNIQLTQVNENNRPSQVFGSYAYMAPEQISPQNRNETLLPVIDIFSFGVLCYEMLTGEYPFGPWNTESDIAEYLYNSKNGIYELSKIQDEKWRKIIEKCLQPKPEHRYPNILAILKSLHLEALNPPIRLKNSPSKAIKILNGEEPGKIVDLKQLFHTKSLLTCGRNSAYHINDIGIKEQLTSYISRRHATFELVNQNLVIRDGQWSNDVKIWMPSKNGTYLNGQKVMEHGQTALSNDIITIGNTTLKIL